MLQVMWETSEKQNPIPSIENVMGCKGRGFNGEINPSFSIVVDQMLNAQEKIGMDNNPKPRIKILPENTILCAPF